MKNLKRERMTISLSRESARFLKSARLEVQAPSMSALFERIVGEMQSRAEQQNYEKQMGAYYDSLSPAAVQEERDWGAIGEAALAEDATVVPEELLALANR